MRPVDILEDSCCRAVGNEVQVGFHLLIPDLLQFPDRKIVANQGLLNLIPEYDMQSVRHLVCINPNQTRFDLVDLVQERGKACAFQALRKHLA